MISKELFWYIRGTYEHRSTSRREEVLQNEGQVAKEVGAIRGEKGNLPGKKYPIFLFLFP